MHDYVWSLRRIAYASMLITTALGLLLWATGDIDLLKVDIFKANLGAVVTFFALHHIFRFVRPKIQDQIQIRFLRHALALLPEALELIAFLYWIPGAVTFASYLVLPWSLSWVDAHLAFPEVWLGVPHWKTFDWVHAAGLLPILTSIYSSIPDQPHVVLLAAGAARPDPGL